jgi:hypothetical protein
MGAYLAEKHDPAWLEGYADDNERRTKWLGGISRATDWRWTRAGLVPAAEYIGPNKKGTKRALLLEWSKDPAAWRAKHGKEAA